MGRAIHNRYDKEKAEPTPGCSYFLNKIVQEPHKLMLVNAFDLE